MSSRFFTTFYLMLLISLGYIATDIYLPSLPAITTYFHTDENHVQLTIFSFLLSFSITPLISGPLSDHIGRKKVLLGGIFLSLIATFLSIFSSTIDGLIIFRFMQGIGLGAVLITSRAIVSDLFTGKELAKQMSVMTMLMPLILAVAPTIGGVLQKAFDWQAVFVFLACYMAFAFICVLFKPESLKKTSHKPASQIFSNYRSHLNNYQFLLFGINFALPSLAMFAQFAVSPFLFQNIIGLSPVEYGNLSLFIGGTILFTGFINFKLIHYFQVKHVLAFGTVLIALSGCLLLIFHQMGILTTWSLLIPILIFYTCIPLCISNAASMAMNLIRDHFGAATALLTTLQFMLGALGSFIFTLVPNDTPVPLALSFIFVGVVSFLNLQYAINRRVDQPVLQNN